MAYNIIQSYAPGFKQVFKKMRATQQKAVEDAILAIASYKRTGAAGFGLHIKHLGPKIYEARIDISNRIVFFSDKNSIRFLAVGNHNDVLRALKQI